MHMSFLASPSHYTDKDPNHPGVVPEIEQVCQFGLGEGSLPVAKRFLDSGSVLHLFDVEPAAYALLYGLKDSYPPGHVNFGVDFADWEMAGVPINCQTVIYSSEAPRFSMERVIPNIRDDYVTFVFLSFDCETTSEDDREDPGSTVMSPVCSYLNSFWAKTKIMWYGRCSAMTCL